MLRALALGVASSAAFLWLLAPSSAIAKAEEAQAEFVNTLMPQPAHITVGSGLMDVGAEIKVVSAGYSDERLEEAIRRTVARLREQTSVRPCQCTAPGMSKGLVISVEGPDAQVQQLGEDESYSLDVTAKGAHLVARTVVGAMRGLETFLQLVQSDGTKFYLPVVSIQDKPRFAWRGLMIDSSRHFVPVEKIKRTLDAMAAVKMNVFHWHLTDDQGFRIESRIFPKLTGMGSDGLFYTQEEAKEIVAYAHARGIRVVPEFDMPGHTTAWLVGYPELASGPGPYQIERHWGIFDPVMDPSRESTYVFLDKFFAEMTTIFPDRYIHIGGDENNGKQWKRNERIQSFMRAHDLKDTAALQGYFNRRVLEILRKHGRKMIGWDEIMSPGLPHDVAVQSWRGFDSLADGAKQGYSGILSAGYYIGHADSTAEHYEVDPLPADSKLTEAEAQRILGGEVCMWGEYVNSRTLDSRVWPAAAAMAERFWSPRSVSDVNEMYRRLPFESLRLESLGLTHLSQMDADLRAMAGTEHIAALYTLASVLEPSPFKVRGPWSEEHGVTQLDPLNHLIDVLRPDPVSRHEFEMLVAEFLKNPTTSEEEKAALTKLFRSWIAASPGAVRLISAAPLLGEAKTRAQQMAELGMLGLEATAYLSEGMKPPVGWKPNRIATLNEMEKPSALVRFTVLKSLREMVNAAQAAQ